VQHRRKGAGIFQLNAQNGIRQSSSQAYLHPTLPRIQNLTVLTNTSVNKILLDEHNTAYAVETDSALIEGGRPQTKVREVNGSTFYERRLLVSLIFDILIPVGRKQGRLGGIVIAERLYAQETTSHARLVSEFFPV
jgi:hypothetical protein